MDVEVNEFKMNFSMIHKRNKEHSFIPCKFLMRLTYKKEIEIESEGVKFSDLDQDSVHRIFRLGSIRSGSFSTSSNEDSHCVQYAKFPSHFHTNIRTCGL